MSKTRFALAILLITFSMASIDAAQGALVSHWKLDETSGPALDNVGANNGTLGGGITQGSTGQINTAYTFSGVAGVSVADAASLKPASFTISAWVNTTDTGNFRGVVDKIDSGVGGYALDVTAGVTRFMLTGSFVTINGPVVNNGQWHMLTGTYNAGTSTMQFYVDGVSQGTQITPMTHTTQGLFFGGDNISTFILNGKIDDIGLWNEPLSGTRIAEIYNNGVNGLDLTTVIPAPEPGMLPLTALGLLAFRYRGKRRARVSTAV
jgi:hypothetical protein